MNKLSENAVTSTVDWLSFTVTWGRLRKNDWLTYDAQMVSCSRILETEAAFKRDIPLHGYEDCWLSPDLGQARIMVSRPGDRMGLHIQLPGQALQALGVAKALRICHELDGSVSRIDIAVDCKGKSDPKDVYDAYQAGKAITRAQKCVMLTGTEGTTVYTGSRFSERFLRVYDKAAQTKTEGNWTRIEMECKGEKAKTIATYLFRLGTSPIGALIRDFMGCPSVAWYTEALTREVVELGAPQPKKTTDTRAWLLGTVAKTLAKETREDDEFLIEFLRLVQAMRKTDYSPDS